MTNKAIRRRFVVRAIEAIIIAGVMLGFAELLGWLTTVVG